MEKLSEFGVQVRERRYFPGLRAAFKRSFSTSSLAHSLFQAVLMYLGSTTRLRACDTILTIWTRSSRFTEVMITCFRGFQVCVLGIDGVGALKKKSSVCPYYLFQIF